MIKADDGVKYAFSCTLCGAKFKLWRNAFRHTCDPFDPTDTEMLNWLSGRDFICDEGTYYLWPKKHDDEYHASKGNLRAAIRADMNRTRLRGFKED